VQELTSRPLSESEWLSLADDLITMLGSASASATVMLGLGARRPIDELWQDEVISTADAASWLRAQIRNGVVAPGFSDVFVTIASPAAEVRLCRSQDVHVKSEDANLIALARAVFLEHGVWNEAANGPST
jgi:hypothetical protein